MNKLSKKAKRQIINFAVLFILIGLTLTVLLLSYQELNFKNIFSFVKNSKWWLLVIAVVCMLLGIVFEGLSLFIISRKLGHKGKFLSSIVYSSSDIYYSAITPSASGGQPAAAYYMCKDGMSAGTASFTLVLNVVAYTVAFLILAVLAFAIRPMMFVQFDVAPKIFIIVGIVIQSVLLLFLIGCMRFHRAVLKVGFGIINVLAKIRIVKKVDKWRAKLEEEVIKYASCNDVIKQHPTLFIHALFYNVCQRVVRVLISCCICLAASPETPFWDVFALQAYVVVGYSSVPLPGGTGAFELLYCSMYHAVYTEQAFIVSAMMVMRFISYYLSIIVTGAITLAYHGYLMRRKPRIADGAPVEQTADATVTETAEITDSVENTENTETENSENTAADTPQETTEEKINEEVE